MSTIPEVLAAAHLGIRLSDKQKLLELLSVKERLSKIIEFMDNEIGVLQVEKKIRSRVKRQMDKTQKEYYLNEQMKAIQKELGESEDIDEVSELEKKIGDAAQQALSLELEIFDAIVEVVSESSNYIQK